MVVELSVIGEVTASVDGDEVNLGPARQRCVLAVLAVEANRLVPADQLADRVWGEHVPYRAAGTLRSYLSRLRTALATGDGFGIQRRPGGYVLSVDESAVDLHRFRTLLDPRAGRR
jgi:DNA-binding SARP family transcriptional activator